MYDQINPKSIMKPKNAPHDHNPCSKRQAVAAHSATLKLQTPKVRTIILESSWQHLFSILLFKQQRQKQHLFSVLLEQVELAVGTVQQFCYSVSIGFRVFFEQQYVLLVLLSHCFSYRLQVQFSEIPGFEQVYVLHTTLPMLLSKQLCYNKQ